MIEINCPKCKDEMQFPYMICPECKWKAKKQDVVKHSQFAESYIAEHPDDRDQLIYVLDLVMKEKVEESEKEVKRSRKNAEMGRKIKVWYIILTGIFGTLWVWYGLAVFFAGTDGTPIPVGGEICLINILSIVSLIVSGVLLVLKLVSLKDR